MIGRSRYYKLECYNNYIQVFKFMLQLFKYAIADMCLLGTVTISFSSEFCGVDSECSNAGLCRVSRCDCDSGVTGAVCEIRMRLYKRCLH